VYYYCFFCEPAVIRVTTKLFPLWAIAFSTLAYLQPSWFSGLAPLIAYLLGVVMLGMGLTLTGESFRTVLTRPKTVVTGVALQFLIMPLAAWNAAWLLGLDPQLAAGLVLVGSAPGGTASNVITYLAGGAVALSITLTAVSTILSVVATPALTWLYVGQSVPVPVWSMLVSILTIVLLPVAAGVVINQLWGSSLGKVKHASPLLSVAAIVLIIAIIVARNHDQIHDVGLAVLAAVVIHNGLGLGLGYAVAKSLHFTEAEARTISIEVGMQNSGLGVVLAQQYFSAIAALPGAIFSIWHNLSGSALASYWSRSAEGQRDMF
jgi:BASS family bile acid:Na+ symporter